MRERIDGAKTMITTKRGNNGQTSPREAFSISRSLGYLSENELTKQLG